MVKVSDFQHSFVMDTGDWEAPFVTVAYDYHPGDPDTGLPETYDVWVFDENGKNITFDISKSLSKKADEKAEEHLAFMIGENATDLAIHNLEH